MKTYIMNREFDRTKFKVLAGILNETHLYEQGQDPYIDYSNIHHQYAERDFEEREARNTKKDEYSLLEVDLSNLSEDVIQVIEDTLSKSSYYRSELGIYRDTKHNSIIIGENEPIPAGNVQREIKRLYDLLRSNTGEFVHIGELFLSPTGDHK